MRSLLALTATLLLTQSSVQAHLPPAHEDAPLRAVQFLNKDHGIAVGDHGTVWLTLDGGKTWDRMKSGTKASLRAVCFVNPLQGWVVGRTESPGGVGAVGVVLSTTDGGLTWAEASTAPLPGLNVVKFFDEERGLAAGDGSDANPSGLFATADGGKTWAAVPGPRTTSWTCGQFVNQSNGVLGGVWSNLCVYTKGEQKPADVDALGGRSVRGLAVDGTAGVAVCDGGAILTTTTGGGRWATADTGLPADAVACLDFHGVSMAGRTAWVAGRPGSVVLKSPDGGKTWEACKTGWRLPLHAICAVSDSEAWAVGELGAILKTSDGGKKWAVQRCGGERAAVLFAHAHGRNLPADAIATVGGRDGYFAAAVSVCGADPAAADRKRCLDEFRFAAAVRAAGGAGGETDWAFPLPAHLGDATPDDLLAAWDKTLDGKAEDRLVRRLVLAIRTWAPDVVAADRLAAAAGPADRLVLTAAQKAFKMADDPTACPEQIDVLGLKPVAPKKLYAITPEPGTDAAVRYDHTRFARTLLNTPQGYAEPAFAVLGEGLSPPAARSFRLVSHRSPGCESDPELTTGLALAEGGSARRKLPQFDPSMEELFTKLSKDLDARRTLEAVIRGAATDADAEKALAMAATTLRKLPDDLACRTAVGLGRHLAAEGKWVAAREVFLIVAARYGTFPEAAEAVRWLARYYASGETRRRADAENFVVMRYTGPTPGADGKVQPVTYTEPVSARQTVRFTDGEATQAWCKACLEMEGKLKAFGPAWTRDPAVLLSSVAARRQLGLTGDAAETLSEYFKATPAAAGAKPGTDLWRDCLAAELWLQNRAKVPVQPKPFALCPKVANKPYLDGKLDDDCWKELKPIETKATAGELKGYATKAYFVYDDEFLYFAVDCTHPDGKALPKAETRRRDDDLRGKDRVDILLDVDRDYQTYYRLQVDQRGCVAEDCWGDRGWNPKWFVAAEPTPTGWTAEIAVPRSELAGGALKAGTTWGMNVTRVVPGSGCQTWSGPPSATPRAEGLGLMQFYVDPKR
jgi:photosystem II stability/assembly factor-like uncharacterized protein